MANQNQLTLTLLPNGTTNSTTVTLTSNSYSASIQFAMQIPKTGGVIDDSGRFIFSDAIVCISIA